MAGRLNGKVCIVTGSTSGIGRGVARLFAAEGGKVAVCGRRVEKGERVVAEIEDAGGEAIYVQMDMASEESIRAGVAKVVDKWGTVDVLVGNAGFGTGPFRFEELDIAKHYDPAFDVMLKGNWIITSACLPYMLEKKNGSVIYTSSIAGLASASGAIAYAASKAALQSTAKSLAVLYGKDNIRFNVVVPGTIASEMSYEGSPIVDITVKNTPMGRVGQPEEIAHVYLLLATDECPFLTGELIPVDGGIITTEMPLDMDPESIGSDKKGEEKN